MTDYEYIFRQVKKFYYTKWDDEELKKCVDKLPSLSREELFTVSEQMVGRCKSITRGDSLRTRQKADRKREIRLNNK